jgi:HEAT repeat protein
LAKAEEAKDAEGKAFKYSSAVRGQVARALCEVGGDMEVPALKTALADFDAREMARWALNRMTCQAATDALIEAASKAVGTEFRVGAVNALATRSASAVLEALKQCAADADPEVRLAAAEALANHADASLDSIIAPVAAAGGPRAESRIARARIRLAAQLAKAGQKDAARGIYQATERLRHATK